MTKFFEHSYALLIGVDENDAQQLRLPAAKNDVNALCNVLTNPNRCGYRRENVKLLQGKGASREGILGGLKWLRDKLKNDTSSNTTAWFYFSGHGAQERRRDVMSYYFIPSNFDRETGWASAISSQEIANAIAKMNPERLVVVLDCCHAEGMGLKGDMGFFTNAIPPSAFEDVFDLNKEEEAMQKGFEKLQQGRGRAVLSSSSALESSYVRSDQRMSVFTYHLIESLTGYAGNTENMSEVLVSDVMSYVTRRVPETVKKEYGHSQTPQYRVDGNFPLALLAKKKGYQEGNNLPDPLENLITGISREHDHNFTLKGDGAIAIGDDSIAVGKGGVVIKGNATNVRINTGSQTETNL